MGMDASSALMAANAAKDALLGIKSMRVFSRCIIYFIKQGNGNMNLVRFCNYFYHCHLFFYSIYW